MAKSENIHGKHVVVKGPLIAKCGWHRSLKHTLFSIKRNSEHIKYAASRERQTSLSMLAMRVDQKLVATMPMTGMNVMRMKKSMNLMNLTTRMKMLMTMV